ncbi:hypothetical protein CQP30_11990 [Yersinia pestis]|nr:hypothetical protein EGX42_12745 [Yersinia pestis]OSZ89416.1 hypothetical protein A7725_09690 [Yersinia pestis subsp. microtus bv. Caucasica]OUY12412.1 hypothetical protein BFI40_19055 [Yersinia pestis subsp. microtus bv. Altaica]OVY73140.1 hypothetical protein BFI50_18390 [Yersinia pestis subsp. microtus bv. Xilingolensis]OVY84951.1 hypothetical protein BFI52_10930 [Yersinia pestis subsp. microtus]QFR86425.1 hypothetical protein DJY80_16845 [Yersinia pestis subsp. pestis bv. Medievalis]
MTNRQGAGLNAACSGLSEAMPMNGPSNQNNQHTCTLQDDGHTILRTKATHANADFSGKNGH